MFYQKPALSIWNDSSVAGFIPKAWIVVIVCVPITLISDQQEGACWVFDRQLMVHEALGRDISENPQVPVPWFPSPPLAAPIKLHTPACVSIGTLSDMIYRSVRFMSAPERWQTIKNRPGWRANSRRTMVRHLWHGRYMLMPLDVLLWKNKTFTYTETFECSTSFGTNSVMIGCCLSERFIW